MFGKLKGKKTYVVAFTASLGAIGSYLVGELSLAEVMPIMIEAVLGATIRHGIKTELMK